MEKKRKAKLITTLSLTVVMLAIMTVPAMAVEITVDGAISDWGLLGLTTGDWSNDNTWVPAPGISFFAEDNQDPLNIGAINYNASYTGVHISGNNTFQEIYHEPLLAGNRVEPYGGTGGKFGEEFDIEAMYVTENSTHIFALIIFSTGLLGDTPYGIGDLALDFESGGGYGYEYGVNFHIVGSTDGQKYGVYSTPTDNCWTIPSPFPQNKPAEIDFSVVPSAAPEGFASVSYSALGKYDFGIDNWVAEIGIPKSAVGNPDLPDDNPWQAIRKFWISETCGNDAGPPSIPEFLTIAIPVGMLLGLIYVHRRKRQGKGREE